MRIIGEAGFVSGLDSQMNFTVDLQALRSDTETAGLLNDFERMRLQYGNDRRKDLDGMPLGAGG